MSDPSPERGAIRRILRAVQFATWQEDAVQFATWQEDVDSPMVDAVIRFNGDDVSAAESELAALEAENGSRLGQLLGQGLLLAKVQRLLGFETEELSPSPNELLGKLMYVLSTRTALEAESADLRAQIAKLEGRPGVS